MLLLSLLCLAIALVAIYISAKVTDEITQLTIALIALFFLFFSLVHAPWPVKLLILVALWVTEKQAHAWILGHLRIGKGREMACPFVKNRRIGLGRLGEGEMRIMCGQPCSYALQKNPKKWPFHRPNTPTLHLPTVPCAPWIQVFPE